MKIVPLTPEVRYLASRYLLLLGFTNEVDAAIRFGDGPPEERLAMIAAMVAFVRTRTRVLPMLCRAERADDPDQQARMLQPWDTETQFQKVNQQGEPLGEPYHVPRVIRGDEDARDHDDAGPAILPARSPIMEGESWDDPACFPYTAAEARHEARGFMDDMIMRGSFLRLGNDELRELFAEALREAPQPDAPRHDTPQ
ncbi:hypothetical protein K2Z83_12900 [Oscillochloris sp. ZM17-4]|uniref:hypothetical protein n=1 Tax=Oscillochloris sp. ZM17-4 TaxID=2866714 RepID=UPI001C73CA0C|nr:hypothetical protein [Oscillochloris sp. ZM17-4]MBX0328576.1 hypothetical protein [Oscillochloris sp. ZM17-4]